jgi:hypothetical protein
MLNLLHRLLVLQLILPQYPLLHHRQLNRYRPPPLQKRFSTLTLPQYQL